MTLARLLARIATVAAALFALLVAAVAVHRGPLPLDGAVRDYFAAVATADSRRLVIPLARLGAREVLLPVLAAGGLVLWWWRRSPGPLVLLAASYFGMALVVGPTKRLLHRPEPFDVAGDIGRSFPSGHAAQAALVYGLLAALVAFGPVARRTRALAAGAALLACAGVGFAMLLRNSHWASDLVAGYAVGVVWLAAPVALALRAAPWLLGLTPGGPSDPPSAAGAPHRSPGRTTPLRSAGSDRTRPTAPRSG
ncbi:MAG TPA: phosphatase PAP2 family protein [Acidimicrobiales bacterium]|nr:phosphatase PAP2 family protein [Acidimicrobiales bacterium]